MFSDQDIKNNLGKNIVIHPFREEDLTPVGYNLRPSDFVFSVIKKELIKANDGIYEIPPNDTVLILTEETVWVSGRVAGTFHSKVGLVSKGFGHISTTLDPNWKGPLLIALNNPTSTSLQLPADKSFVTLIFYEVKTPASKMHDNDPGRNDILKTISVKMLGEEVDKNKRDFLAKAVTVIDNDVAYQEFKTRYDDLVEKSLPSLDRGFKAYVNELKSKNLIRKAFYIWDLAFLSLIMYKFMGWLLKASFPAIVTHFALLQCVYSLIDKATFVAMIAIFIASVQATISLREDR